MNRIKFRKMTRSLLLWGLMASLLVMSCAAAFAEEQTVGISAEEKGSMTIPAVGEVIHGFEVKEIREFPVFGSELVLFEHQKTGAGLMWIANEDTNRAFQLTFLP